MSTHGRPGRVLYVTYDGLLEPLGASQVLPYVRRLAAAGVPMEILSFEKPEDVQAGGAVHALKGALGAHGIGWTWFPYHRRPSLPATAWDVAAGRRHVARWARAVSKDGVNGIVHARSYLPGLMGLAGRRHAGVRLLFDMRGFWVDERIEDGYWAPGSLNVRLGRAVERTLLRKADHLVLLTHRSAGRLPELAGSPAIPSWTVVPTCVDLEKFTPAEDAAEARRRVGLSRSPVLVHVGTLKGRYEGGRTMEVARAFLERTAGSFIVLTRDLEESAALARRAGIDAVVKAVPSAQVPRWLQAADVGIALMRTTPSKDASYPTKVGEYLAAGLAVLGTPVGDMERLGGVEILRLMRDGDTPEDAAAWLADAAAHPRRQALARGLAEASLGLDQGVDALLGVYATLGVAGSGA